MKSKVLFVLIVLTFVLTKNVVCQTIHIATGQNFVPKSGLAVENTKSIPFFIGVNYLQRERIYLTTNLGLLKRNYQIDDKVETNYILANSTIDFYFTKDFPVRPFIGAGFHVSYLLTDNLDKYNTGQNIEFNKMLYGILARFGARQKFSKFEIALISDTYFNLNGQGKHDNKKISGYSETIMIHIGIPLNIK